MPSAPPSVNRQSAGFPPFCVRERRGRPGRRRRRAVQGRLVDRRAREVLLSQERYFGGKHVAEENLSRLVEASARLEQALERLDRALQEKAAGEEETEALRAALNEARKEHENLREVSEQVSERLDATIKRLNGVLES